MLHEGRRGESADYDTKDVYHYRRTGTSCDARRQSSNNAQPGDVILYNGSNICIFYGTNSWSYTRLGKIDGLSESELRTFLKAGEGNITVTLSLSSGTTTINSVRSVATENDAYYSLSGQRLAQAPAHGIYIENGIKKIAR